MFPGMFKYAVSGMVYGVEFVVSALPNAPLLQWLKTAKI